MAAMNERSTPGATVIKSVSAGQGAESTRGLGGGGVNQHEASDREKEEEIQETRTRSARNHLRLFGQPRHRSVAQPEHGSRIRTVVRRENQDGRARGGGVGEQDVDLSLAH